MEQQEPLPYVTYRFKDLYKEIIIRSPKKVGSVGSRYKKGIPKQELNRICSASSFGRRRVVIVVMVVYTGYAGMHHWASTIKAV